MYLTTQARTHAIFDNSKLMAPRELAIAFLEFSKYKEIYDQVRLLDRHGMEVVRINYNAGQPAIVGEDGLQNKGKRYYFTDTIRLHENGVYVSPFDLNIEQDQVEIPHKPMINSALRFFPMTVRRTALSF